MTRTMIAAGVALIATLVSVACGGPGEDGTGLGEMTIAAPALEQNALLYVAESQGFLADNRLDVVIEDFPTGPACLDAVLGGRADIAEAAEFPVLAAIFEGQPLKIVACNDTFENDYIAIRTGSGVTVASDLEGKRIGVTLGTINEFYLGRFLDLNGLAESQVVLVDLKPERFVGALASGEVDAVVAWEPYVDEIEKVVPGVMVWPAQNSQQVFGTLVARDDWLAGHGLDLERLLNSLREAEDFVRQNPEKAQAIVQDRLGYDAEYVDEVWPRHDFALSLSQSLITALTDEAQWVIHRDPSVERVLPDFRAWVSATVLEKVKPDSIDIVR